MSDISGHRSMQPAHSAQAAMANPADPRSAEPQPMDAAEMPMTVHPFVVAVALAGWGWAVLVLFLCFLFLGNGEATGVVVIVGGVSLLIFGLLVGCGVASRNVATRAGVKLRQPANFHEFLTGEVQVGDDRMKGSEIFGLAVVMGLTLAIIGTGMVIAIAVA